jgi:hypothetical protein
VPARVTVTPVTGPFSAQTCTVQEAAWPAWTLSWLAWTLTHRSAGVADDAAAVGEGVAEAVEEALSEAAGVAAGVGTGSGWHWVEIAASGARTAAAAGSWMLP